MCERESGKGAARSEGKVEHPAAKSLWDVVQVYWPEPFGLVMIEAMACGTPVIAYRAGSVPEVVEDGVTGFIVESEEEAVAAVSKLGRLDRRMIRARFEERFSARRMVREYENLYRNLTATNSVSHPRMAMRPQQSIHSLTSVDPSSRNKPQPSQE
jgi:Glycosyl transferases group 1